MGSKVEEIQNQESRSAPEMMEYSVSLENLVVTLTKS